MRKFIIEITEDSIKKTFIDGDKTYEEEWVQDENGSRTIESSIVSQLDQYGDFNEPELLELLEVEDLEGIWEYFCNN